MRHLILFLCVTVILPLSAQTKVLRLPSRTSGTNYADQVPTRTVSRDSTGMTVEYEIPTAISYADDLYEGTNWFKITGFGLNCEEETPSLPQRVDIFDLPDNCVSATVTMLDAEKTTWTMELTPARVLLLDSDDETYTKSNVKPIKRNGVSGANNIATMLRLTKYRGHLRANVMIKPVHYDMDSTEVTTYHHFSYRIDYELSDGDNTSEASAVKTDTSVQDELADEIDMLGKFIPDSTQLRFPIDTTKTYTMFPTGDLADATSSYLFVTTPDYCDAISELVALKELQGFNVAVCSKNGWTTDEVSDSIKHYYQTMDNLEYVLLVGDNESLPAYSYQLGSSNEDNCLTDYLYAYMDSDDEADLYIGRLPIYKLSTAQYLVDKIVEYETNPPVNEDFYDKAMHATYFQTDGKNLSKESRRFVHTSEMVRDYMMQQGKTVNRVYCAESEANPLTYSDNSAVPEELQRDNFAWNGDSSDLISEINAGRFYILHRDHGSNKGWTHPSFTVSDVPLLSNGKLQPIVFSINCASGDFSQTNLATSLLSVQNGGSVGVFAATGNTYSKLNDVMALGMFNAIYPSPGLNTIMKQKCANNQISIDSVIPVYTLGEILSAGKMAMRESYDNGTSQSSKKSLDVNLLRFHVFGDPSMMMYTAAPREFTDDEIKVSRVDYSNQYLTACRLTITVNNDEDTYIVQHNTSDGTSVRYKCQNGAFTCIASTSTTIYVYGHNRLPMTIPGYVEDSTTSTTAIATMTLAPNPTVSSCTLTIDADDAMNGLQAVIFDFNGNQVATVAIADESDVTTIDTSSLKSGQYFVCLMQNGVKLDSKTLIVK
jgi:hypothetical protein